jgi:glycosyltransferase involved in cell wall biosynthesis
MKVLYLYTEIMGYNIPIFEELVKHYGATVDVVHWDQNKNTPYLPSTSLENIRFHRSSGFTPQSLCAFVATLQPDLVYTSGWQDKGYRPALQKLKSLGTPVVMGLDSQWTGSLRQQVGARVIKHFFKERYFSYAWVPGPLQYECAARLGFKHSEIISHLLTGNTQIFSQAALALDQQKVEQYPKQFLYVGRLTEPKGINTLIAAYRKYKDIYKGSWGLTCVGNGSLEQALRQHADIVVEPFVEQVTLVEHALHAGALVVPSRYEPWGVVVHEFAAAGLPLVLSDKVGAKQQLLIEGLNGYEFEAGSIDGLAQAMRATSSQSDERLLGMSRHSQQLSLSLSPEIATASFVSVLSRQQRAVQDSDAPH